MPFIISFIGWHNSGKTTLATRVVALLRQQGLQIGVIKKTKEAGLLPERPNTDTALYTSAGASRVALLAPDQLVLRSEAQHLTLTSLANNFFFEMDMVIAEGFKTTKDVPKIAVVRSPEEKSNLLNLADNVLAVVSEHGSVNGLPHFSRNDIDKLTAFILSLWQTACTPQPDCTVELNGILSDLPVDLQHHVLAITHHLAGQKEKETADWLKKTAQLLRHNPS